MTTKEQPFTDLDLCFIANGRLVIGEVKSTPAGFHEADIKKLGAVASDLLPDEVVLASRGTSWPPDALEMVNLLKEMLAGHPVVVTTKLSNW